MPDVTIELEFPELPEYGKHLYLACPGKRTIWKIYRHPDKVLDNLAIAEKIVNKKKPDKRWIVGKDYLDWVKNLVGQGYTCKIEED